MNCNNTVFTVWRSRLIGIGRRTNLRGVSNDGEDLSRDQLQQLQIESNCISMIVLVQLLIKSSF